MTRSTSQRHTVSESTAIPKKYLHSQ